MARGGEAGKNSGEGARIAFLPVSHQSIRIGPILLGVAVAGNDQVIGERSHYRVQMSYQWFPLPVPQSLVTTTHAVALAAGQQQDGAGERRIDGHQGIPAWARDITPA